MRPLWNPDETRYTEIAQEMVKSGDYTVPTLNYVPYFEKPIFSYWLTAISIKLFDLTRFSARLPVVLLGALGAVLAYLFALSLKKSRITAITASFIIATSMEWAALSTTLTTDMIFTFFLNFCWYAFWKIYSTENKKFLIWKKEIENTFDKMGIKYKILGTNVITQYCGINEIASSQSLLAMTGSSCYCEGVKRPKQSKHDIG